MAVAAARAFPVYPIGTKGQPWGTAERDQWRSLQTKKRSYVTDVVNELQSIFSKDAALAAVAEITPYGHLDYTNLGLSTYDLFAVKSKDFSKDRRTVVVTGGVHGYETSGVHGALLFIREKFVQYAPKVNLIILPCITPWAYETINRWNPEAVDPNRSFDPAAPKCQEAGFAMKFVLETGAAGGDFLVHTDLHETTDTDNSEFSPAKFARDGTDPEPWSEIPDGFYVVADSSRPMQMGFYEAQIAAVRKVTHIAPADENGCLIGDKIIGDGIVPYPCIDLHLCASFTPSPYVTTTEVYPDSPKTNADECNRAQVACVEACIDYALAHL